MKMNEKRLANGLWWDRNWLQMLAICLPSFSVTVWFIVNSSMAITAKSEPIPHVVPALFVVLPWVDVMGFEITALVISAVLTSVVVTLENRRSPNLVSRIATHDMVLRCNPSFPVRVGFTYKKGRSILDFGETRLPYLLAVFWGKFNSFTPLVFPIPFHKRISRFNRNSVFLSQFNPDTRVTPPRKPIAAAPVFRKIRHLLPFVALTATSQPLLLLGKIFLIGKTNLKSFSF